MVLNLTEDGLPVATAPTPHLAKSSLGQHTFAMPWACVAGQGRQEEGGMPPLGRPTPARKHDNGRDIWRLKAAHTDKQTNAHNADAPATARDLNETREALGLS